MISDLQTKINFLSFSSEHRKNIFSGCSYSKDLVKDIEILFDLGIQSKISEFKKYLTKRAKELSAPQSKDFVLKSEPTHSISKLATIISDSWIRYWLLYDAASDGFFSAYYIHKLEQNSTDIVILLNKFAQLGKKSELTRLYLNLLQIKNFVDITKLKSVNEEKDLNAFFLSLLSKPDFVPKTTLMIILEQIKGERYPFLTLKESIINLKDKIINKNTKNPIPESIVEDYNFIIDMENCLRSYNEKIMKEIGVMLELIKSKHGLSFPSFIELFKFLDQNKKILTGVSAEKGVYSGIAKIVNSFEDTKRVMQGDILVTYSTYPDILPAIMNAGAIITESGGLLSHAAIVAREFNIPTVIGVDFATKIIKDGDKIIVDANNGKVIL